MVEISIMMGYAHTALLIKTLDESTYFHGGIEYLVN